MWPTDGTDETTLQAVNVDSQNRKLEENIQWMFFPFQKKQNKNKSK